jgi:hypothetical protein
MCERIFRVGEYKYIASEKKADEKNKQEEASLLTANSKAHDWGGVDAQDEHTLTDPELTAKRAVTASATATRTFARTGRQEEEETLLVVILIACVCFASCFE